MKSAFFVSGFLLFFAFVAAQDPAAEARRRMSERTNTGNTGTFVTPAQPRQETIISYTTYLSQEREWSDASGRKMTGRLVAFSAPEPGKTGPIVVTNGGKVRLRRTGAKANSDLELDQLSQGDQLFVKAIEAGIAKQATASQKPEE